MVSVLPAAGRTRLLGARAERVIHNGSADEADAHAEIQPRALQDDERAEVLTALERRRSPGGDGVPQDRAEPGEQIPWERVEREVADVHDVIARRRRVGVERPAQEHGRTMRPESRPAVPAEETGNLNRDARFLL